MPFRIGTKVNWVALVNFSSEKKKTLVLYSSIETSETKKCSRLWTWSYPHRLIWHFWDLSWWYCSFFNVHIYILPGIEKKKVATYSKPIKLLARCARAKIQENERMKRDPAKWLTLCNVPNQMSEKSSSTSFPKASRLAYLLVCLY